ncbi:hypothetical protein MPER_07577 [Moniliophthora perniciosa FA553]|nr:hypothetical protein MPER_07577 [Moniliophthora perniciosa FA553]
MSAEPSSLTPTDVDNNFQEVLSRRGSRNKSGRLAEALESEHATIRNGDLKGAARGPCAPKASKPIVCYD